MPLLRTLASLMLATPLVAQTALPPHSSYNYDEAKVGSLPLPDPLRMENGAPVRSARDWREVRRPELLELFAREMFGRTPAARPAGLHARVTSVDRAALGGKAVRKEITVWFTPGTDGPKMNLLVYQPADRPGRPSRWPAFLGLNFHGNHTVHADPGITLATAWVRDEGGANGKASDAKRGSHASRWDVEAVLARGFATATVYCGDLCEDRPEGLTRDVAALFRTGDMDARAGDAWGAIGIWAWGLSRALDYLETDPEIDAKRVAVHGHSRLGKAALWAGAQDERFALVISNNSGAGGAALSKRIYGETVARLNQAFPHWFSRNFRKYNDRETDLPFDSHQLLALVAPRPLYVASAVEDRWADPRGEFLAVKHVGPVYTLLGEAPLGAVEMPPVDQPLHSKALAYHIRTGKHDITPYDWEHYSRFAALLPPR